MVPSGVAAGHPATVAAGIEILEEGGTAADAAVAACLASCVAETVMTGLLGGGHAIYFDGERGVEPRLLRRRAVGRGRAARRAAACRSARSSSTTRSGRGRARCRGFRAGSARCTGASAACPGRGSSSRRCGSRATGVVMPPAHAACLAMLGPVFTMQPDGERIYAPAGRLLEAGETLAQPGLATALELLAAEGADSVYAGSIAELLTAVEGVPCHRCRPGALRGALGGAGRGRVARPPRPHARRLVRQCPRRSRGCRGCAISTRRRACTRCSTRSTAPDADGHTTNLVTADARRRASACSRRASASARATSSPASTLQLNSMLGEVDLVRAPLRPGERMGSMMAPTLAFGERRHRAGDRLGRRHPAPHGARRRRRGDPRRGARSGRRGRAAALPPRRRRRQRRAGRRRAGARRAERGQGCRCGAGRAQHHYFGGVSLIGTTGAAGDPRRSGHAATLP